MRPRTVNTVEPSGVPPAPGYGDRMATSGSQAPRGHRPGVEQAALGELAAEVDGSAGGEAVDETGAPAPAPTTTHTHPTIGDGIDAVLFDAGGILVLPDPLGLGMALAPFGGDTALHVHHRAHYTGMFANAQAEAPGPVAWRAYVDAYLEVTGVPAGRMATARKAFVRSFGHRAWRFPILDTLHALERLSERDVPMGIVSNAAGQVAGVLANQSICQVGAGGGVAVSVIVDSGVAGVEKPDPAIFEPALVVLAAEGIEPDRIAYVGDSARYDLPAAHGAGLVPFLLDPYGLHSSAALRDGSHRITSVHDLLGRVAEEAGPVEPVEPPGRAVGA